MGTKEKILDEIMNLMDEEDGKKLMKHPKLVAMKVTTAKPVEKMAEGEPEGDECEEMDDDMIEELMAALKKKK